MEEDAQDQRHSLAVKDRREVEILGDRLTAARVEDGTIYLPLRGLCDALGLETQGQSRRIRRDEAMRDDLQTISIETEGGVQSMQVLPLETVPYWLAGITLSKVKPDLRDKLLAYKRWVVRKVYEAFMLEIGAMDLSEQKSATISALFQVRDMGLAIARLAENQIDMERRQTTVESRLDRAAAFVGDINRRLARVERRLDPAEVLTEEQAAAVSSRVKSLAMLLTGLEPGKNHFGGIFGELYRRCGVSDYKSIRQEQYGEVISFLDEWRERVMASELTS